jgi:hypothetical protein
MLHRACGRDGDDGAELLPVVAGFDHWSMTRLPDSLTLPSGDLLGGLTPSVSGGTYGTAANASSAPIGVLTDGVIGPVGCCTSSDTFFVGDGGVDITIDLPTPSTIDQINTYTNWNYDRIAQLYTILTSTDGTDFTPLITVDDTYDAIANVLLGQVTGFSLSGVEAIRWSFDTTQTGVGSDFAAYSELAAYDTDTAPEPASSLLLGAGLIAIAGRWRKRKA